MTSSQRERFRRLVENCDAIGADMDERVRTGTDLTCVETGRAVSLLSKMLALLITELIES